MLSPPFPSTCNRHTSCQIHFQNRQHLTYGDLNTKSTSEVKLEFRIMSSVRMKYFGVVVRRLITTYISAIISLNYVSSWLSTKHWVDMA